MSIRRLIPHLFTAGNLVGGILAIVFTLEGRIDIAPYFILISAALDFLDGFVARLLKVQSELGKQLDSLADMVTFGVAPGIMMYWMLDPFFIEQYVMNLVQDISVNNGEYLDVIWTIENAQEGTVIVDNSQRSSGSLLPLTKHFSFQYISFLIPVFALFRLAKFNLDENQKDGFIGLPTPAMTIFVASIPLIAYNIGAQELIQLEVLLHILQPFSLVLITVILSILMVVPMKLFALKFKSFGWKGNELRYLFILSSAILLGTLFWWSLPIITVLYLVLSIINNITTKSAKNEIQS
ncbi:MAG: CDP-alcohol phosphatidyltransferase family protein [Crocinitomicaceae bacterium]|nr:CDP-alcohol phosphatidyltransferase family protein [Crocinitomicaceae bacterium]